MIVEAKYYVLLVPQWINLYVIMKWTSSLWIMFSLKFISVKLIRHSYFSLINLTRYIFFYPLPFNHFFLVIAQSLLLSVSNSPDIGNLSFVFLKLRFGSNCPNLIYLGDVFQFILPLASKRLNILILFII